MSEESAVTVERRDKVLLIGLNRPAKRNAFNLAMIDQLAAANHELEANDEIRCGVLFGHGDQFTGGLDLAEVGPLVREGRLDESFSGPGRRDHSIIPTMVESITQVVSTCRSKTFDSTVVSSRPR